jgi:hypothetical protein
VPGHVINGPASLCQDDNIQIASLLTAEADTRVPAALPAVSPGQIDAEDYFGGAADASFWNSKNIEPSRSSSIDKFANLSPFPSCSNAHI